jgi:L-gulono-1,4-lactone dehydrogenase
VERMRATVQAGITVNELSRALEARGLALPNLGDIDVQTISGALATATHGTGAARNCIAAQVVGMRLISGEGSVVECSEDEQPELLRIARVGLGALGIVSTVTLQCVPAFKLRAVEQPMRLDAVLDGIDEHVGSHDFFEFFWVPHTRWALTKANDVTEAPLDPLPRFKHWYSKSLMENTAFGLMCRLGRAKPSLIPRLATALPGSGRVEFTDQSWKVFSSIRSVRFKEMEYAIPREACASALRAVTQMVESEGLLLNFPVEVRFLAADDIPLSTASGRDSCYIAVHVFQGMEHERYFGEVERIMDDHDGRPHWGKMHFQSAETLAPRYPGWAEFAAVRDRLDPDRRFTNTELRRVLGS